MNNHQVRRCLVCGQRTNKWDLIRFVKQNVRMVFDSKQTMPGRGVYCHQTAACFSRLTEAKLWGRAVGRRGGVIDRQSVLEAVDNARISLGIFRMVTDV